MIAEKTLALPRRSVPIKRKPRPTTIPALPQPLPNLHPVSILICFYREPEEGPSFRRWEEAAWDNICLRFEEESLEAI